MRLQAEQERDKLVKEWEKRLKEAVDKARKDEIEKAKGELEKVR